MSSKLNILNEYSPPWRDSYSGRAKQALLGGALISLFVVSMLAVYAGATHQNVCDFYATDLSKGVFIGVGGTYFIASLFYILQKSSGQKGLAKLKAKLTAEARAAEAAIAPEEAANDHHTVEEESEELP